MEMRWKRDGNARKNSIRRLQIQKITEKIQRKTFKNRSKISSSRKEA